MSQAALVLGILAAILAAICTAPCFGWFAFFGAPVAVAGLIVGLLALVQTARQRGRPGAPPTGESLRHALSGIALSTAAGTWMTFMVLMKGLWL